MVATDRIVVVTGATGRQGGAVARHLLSDGWRVRALTRKPEGKRARGLAALGAEVRQADMAQPDTLRPAFRDAYGAFSVQNFMIAGREGEIMQGKNVADVAKNAGVQHVVYGSSSIGKPTGIGSWDSKLTVQAHMEALGLPLTVLRPMAFMELMTDRDFFPPVSTWYLMPKLMGTDRPVLWLCADDLGRSRPERSPTPAASSARISSWWPTSSRTPSAARSGGRSPAGAPDDSRCRRRCSSASSAPI